MTIEQLLRDPNTELTDEFLAMTLGDNFTLWKALNEELRNFDVSLEWRHYRGGSWLAKAVNKKKRYWGAPFQIDFFRQVSIFLKHHICGQGCWSLIYPKI